MLEKKSEYQESLGVNLMKKDNDKIYVVLTPSLKFSLVVFLSDKKFRCHLFITIKLGFIFIFG